MALQKVFLIGDDKDRCSEVITVLNFLDYKVKLLTLDKLQSEVNDDESPLVILCDDVSFKDDEIHSFYSEPKHQQPFLYLHNKG